MRRIIMRRTYDTSLSMQTDYHENVVFVFVLVVGLYECC